MSTFVVRSSSRRSSALRRGFASLIQPHDQTVAIEQDTRREIECVTERLRADMLRAAGELNFEEAASLRDRLKQLEALELRR